jgi:hypothetical protein
MDRRVAIIGDYKLGHRQNDITSFYTHICNGNYNELVSLFPLPVNTAHNGSFMHTAVIQ